MYCLNCKGDVTPLQFTCLYMFIYRPYCPASSVQKGRYGGGGGVRVYWADTFFIKSICYFYLNLSPALVTTSLHFESRFDAPSMHVFNKAFVAGKIERALSSNSIRTICIYRNTVLYVLFIRNLAQGPVLKFS